MMQPLKYSAPKIIDLGYKYFLIFSKRNICVSMSPLLSAHQKAPLNQKCRRRNYALVKHSAELWQSGVYKSSPNTLGYISTYYLETSCKWCSVSTGGKSSLSQLLRNRWENQSMGGTPLTPLSTVYCKRCLLSSLLLSGLTPPWSGPQFKIISSWKSPLSQCLSHWPQIFIYGPLLFSLMLACFPTCRTYKCLSSNDWFF